MPAWTESASRAGRYLGVKVVNVFPGNSARGVPAVLGVYVLQSGRTGETLAAIDGTRLTHWRTAAASALAARHLARADAKRLLIVGAGALAPFLARAHASVRGYDEIAVWNHRPEGARKLAASLADIGLPARPAEDLEAAVAEADVVSCATLATEPLIAGRWLKPGQHLDLVGAFNMSMREADDEALRRARIYVDTDAALVEGGDVAVGILGGAIDRSAVIADLPALCRGAPGRRNGAGDHPVQVGRRGDRGPRGGDPGVAQGGRRGAVNGASLRSARRNSQARACPRVTLKPAAGANGQPRPAPARAQ